LKRVFRFLSVSSGLLTSRLVLGMVVHWLFWLTDSRVTVYMGAALFTTTLAICLTFLFDTLADLLESKGVALPRMPTKDKPVDGASDAEAQLPLTSTTTKSRSNSKSKRTGVATVDDVGQHIATSTRGLISVFGLLVGLSWEAVFEVGEHDMVQFVNRHMVTKNLWQHEHPVLVEVMLSIAVLVCVVPVWAMHLVPAAEKDRAYHKACIDAEQNSETQYMFTFSVLRKLFLSCCPVWRRCSCCKGRKANA